MKSQNQHQNQLVLYRRRMKFSQKYVSCLLGQSDTSMISRYERGRSRPPLAVALRLEIIYRAPVAFLFEPLYQELRQEIRALEGKKTGGQLPLF